MSYDALNSKNLGLEPVLAYHCQRCGYRWLPRDSEIMKWNDLASRKPPKSCAKCKTKQWRTQRERKRKQIPMTISKPRIKTLLKSNKLEHLGLAAFMLNHTDDTEEFENILRYMEKQMSPKEFKKFKEIVSKKYASKPLELETFTPI